MTYDLSTLDDTQMDRLTTLLVQSGHLNHPMRLQAHVETDTEATAIAAQLATSLPAHAIPETIVTASTLPRLPNGKLDRASLAAVQAPKVATKSESGDSATKETLRGIWADVLGMDQIHDEDNFFELGGDSLLSISVVSRARTEGLNLIPSDLFDYATLGELAAKTQVAADTETMPDVGFEPLGATSEGETKDQMFIINANRRMLELLNEQLTTRRSIHLLTMHWDSGYFGKDATVGTIAREFIERIRAIQPHGPYRLGGFSMGAVVSYEVAQLLLANGEEIKDLVLIDPPENASLFAGRFNKEHAFEGHKEDRLSLKHRLGNACIAMLVTLCRNLGLNQPKRFNSRIAATAYLKAAKKYKIKPPNVPPLIVRRQTPKDTSLWAYANQITALHQIPCTHHDFFRDEATIRQWTGLLAQSLEMSRT